ncbi:MAG: hypothetical protein CMF72_23085 [Mameliella sp.]|nr:hypothetical protein [Mameliella sp.]|tara:strand:- start:1443 stop:2252 length:810 start_codon:yes stop_codon:yes gene_type:complete
MSIELSVRGVGQDQSQSLVVDTGIALSRATEITLPTGTPAIVRHEKFGRDLAVQFEDGQTLRIENFFVMDPEGEFSRVLDEGGDTKVTGLIAPEPSMDDMGDGIEADPAGGGERVDATPQHAFVPGAGDDAGGGFFGESSTILSAGAGLAAGYGSMSLLSSEGDDGDSKSHSASSAAANKSDDDAGLLEQDLEVLLGAPAAEDDLMRALAAEFASATFVDDALGALGDLAAPPQDGGLVGPLFAETSPMPIEMGAEYDLLLPLTAEGDT